VLIPYRVKNPPKKFPFATLGLIAINILVFACTTSSLSIRESVVKDYAYTFGASPLLNFISAAFLHGDIFHILGNMLFLWVFGPSVEDRLGIPKYLALYFITGFMGDVCQGGLDVILFGASRPGIGASGCIMGVVGAYWYLFSWSTVCVAYWITWFFRGIWEVKAIWIIGLYVLMDVGEGVLDGTMGIAGGVANFAHVGGAITGVLLCLAVRAKRDTEAMSEARAIHADARDLDNMPFHALQTMIEEDPKNLDLLRAMIVPAAKLGQQAAIDRAFEAYGPQLAVDDPGLVAHYLTRLQGKPDMYQSLHLLRVAGIMERNERTDQAIDIYKLIADGRPTDPASESACYRVALCTWNTRKDGDTARKYLLQIKQRFPHGDMMAFARQLWNQMQPPKQ
jgi:membrane associated rhomboid family serine protease